MFKNQNLFRIKLVLSLFLIMFIYTGCCTLFCPDSAKSNIEFATLLDKTHRLGPIELPLDKDEKNAIQFFLIKGGDNESTNLVDPGAKERYSGLLDLLSQEEFLSSKNFVESKNIKRVSPQLRQWFKKTVIYRIVDATKTPPFLNEIAVTDGSYWWVFLRSEDKKADGHFAIVQLLISSKAIKEKKHFE